MQQDLQSHLCLWGNSFAFVGRNGAGEVAELMAREPEDARRIRPVRVALQHQRDDLLAFAGLLDGKLAGIGVMLL